MADVMIGLIFFRQKIQAHSGVVSCRDDPLAPLLIIEATEHLALQLGQMDARSAKARIFLLKLAVALLALGACTRQCTISTAAVWATLLWSSARSYSLAASSRSLAITVLVGRRT